MKKKASKRRSAGQKANGQLKKGYKFKKGGGTVKVAKKKAAKKKKTTRRKKR